MYESAIDQWLSNHRQNLEQDILRLVNIKSVSQKGTDGAPFGEGCKRALEELLAIGREHGFSVHNFENYCASLWTEEKDAPTIGFWGHLDVVPEGEDWDYAPYNAQIHEHYIIGRGAQDNKGPTVANLYLIQCIKELGIPLRYNLKLFAGCDEEHGMADMEYYTSHYPCPELSIITDCGFPVCYGEKGILEARLISNRPVSREILSLCGGIASNVVPDRADMRIRKTPKRLELLQSLDPAELPISYAVQEDAILLHATGTSKHTASPKGGINAIQVLAEAVSSAPFSSLLSPEDLELLAFLNQVNQDFEGTGLGIRCEDGVSGALTCVGSLLSLEDSCISLGINIRYPIAADSQRLLTFIQEACAAAGYHLALNRDSKPNYFPKAHPAVQTLTDCYNELMGLETKPYVMGGGTYARKLPHALAFGMGLPGKDEALYDTLFRPGHGGAHGPDEALDVDKLIQAIKIMILCLINLNDIEL